MMPDRTELGPKKILKLRALKRERLGTARRRMKQKVRLTYDRRQRDYEDALANLRRLGIIHD
jgi:hypothetical protein